MQEPNIEGLRQSEFQRWFGEHTTREDFDGMINKIKSSKIPIHKPIKSKTGAKKLLKAFIQSQKEVYSQNNLNDGKAAK